MASRYLAIILLLFLFCGCSAEHDRKKALQYQASGNYGEAIKWLDKIIDGNPDDYEAYYTRGNVLVEKGNFEKAIEDYTIASCLEPRNPDPFYGRAKAKLSIKDYSGAISDCDSVIDRLFAVIGDRFFIPRNPNVNLMGKTNHSNDRGYDEVNIFFVKGSAYYGIDSLTQAVSCFSYCIKQGEYMQLSHLYRGFSYLRLGLTVEGNNDLKASAELGNEDAVNYLKKIQKQDQ